MALAPPQNPSQVSSRDSSGEKPSIRRHLLGGTVVALLLTAGLGGWAASTELAGAVVASGTVVVDSKVKTVHPPPAATSPELLLPKPSLTPAAHILIRP